MHQLYCSLWFKFLKNVCFQILHASGQIDILCNSLREISPEKNNQKLAVSITKKLIGKHQKIIIFSNKIEKIFCYIALIQFMSSTLVTCCLGFMIVTVSRSLSKAQASCAKRWSTAQFDFTVNQRDTSLQYDRWLGINESYSVLHGCYGRGVYLLLLRGISQCQGRNAQSKSLDSIHIVETTQCQNAIRSYMISDNGNCISIMENISLFIIILITLLFFNITLRCVHNNYLYLYVSYIMFFFKPCFFTY